MRISYNWLQTFFEDTLPEPKVLQEEITMHSFEVESLTERGGDAILDVKVLPDRAHDALSHWGMAKEVSALTGLKLREDLFHKIELGPSEALYTEIENPKDTLRFAGVLIENVRVKDSPGWLKERLESIGLKPINNIVDATNYILFAYGQPMHAYDRAKLEEKNGKWNLRAERAGREERFTALDGKEYAVEPDFLVIRDTNSGRTLGLAGIKGGNASKIDETTSDIILEAATFNATLIRKTSQRLKLRTDASERFEKEIIPELALRAMKEAVILITDIAGGPDTLVEGLSDAYPKRRSTYRVGLGLRDVEKKLGVRVSEDDLMDILTRLGCEIRRAETRDILTLAESTIGAPYKLGASISFDAPQAFDCSSLTAYLFSQIGYAIPRISVDQYFFAKPIEKKDLRAGDLIFMNSETGHIHRKSIEFLPGKEVLAGVDHVGLYLGEGEIIHASPRQGKVVRERIADNPNIHEHIVGYGRVIFDDVRYVVTVPLERLDLMSKRAFLVSGNKEDLIEEIGRVYGYENIPSMTLGPTSFKPEINASVAAGGAVRRLLASLGLSEVKTYAMVNVGEVEIENPIASDKAYLRDSLLPELGKVLKQNVLNKDILGLKTVKIFEIGKVFKTAGESMRLGLATERAKELEETLLAIEEALGQKLAVVMKTATAAEVDLDEFFNKLTPAKRYDFTEREVGSYSPISLYPFISRDLALFVPEGTKPQAVEKIFAPLVTHLCVRFGLFDSFLKTFPDESRKQSYAWRFVFQSHERTLTDAEVNAIMDAVYKAVQAKGYEVR